MATMKSRVELESRSIAEQAAEWLLILEEDRPADREAFADWLRQSPLHVGAFLRASAVDRLATGLDPEKSIAIEMGPFPDALDVGSAATERKKSPELRRFATFGFKPLALAASVVIAVLAAALLLRNLSADEWRHYSAAVGEQRILELEDGSTLYLQPGSSVDTLFIPGERRLRLVNGEAMFKVHHDKSRPFRVISGRAVVQAVGTQFRVSKVRDDSVVTVVEGVVQVSRERSAVEKLSAPLGLGPAKVQPVKLSAGEETRVASNGDVPAPKPANVDPVKDWKENRLTFINETLFAIAEEFNRFNRAPKIRVEDAGAGELRYAASFDAYDPDSLAVVLEKDPNLSVERRADEIVIRSR